MDGTDAPARPPGHGHAALPPGTGLALRFLKVAGVVVLFVFHPLAGLLVGGFFVFAATRRTLGRSAPR